MTILDKIIAQKMLEVKELKTIYSLSAKRTTTRDSLYDRLNEVAKMGVIAEVKRASPSKGNINDQVDPVAQAKKYEQAGASAISVLTDRHFFKGSMADLSAVAQELQQTPLLCKDFIIDRVQIDAAVDHGASVILLIAAALTEEELADLYDYAKSLDLDVLFEVHDEREAETALKIGANIIGINNRDLKTFKVDLGITERVATLLQAENKLIVSESGIRTRQDAKRVEAAGARAILVGETFMRSSNISETMSEIRIPLQKAVR